MNLRTWPLANYVTRKKSLVDSPPDSLNSTGRGNRTLTRLPSLVFETSASTVPPPRLVLCMVSQNALKVKRAVPPKAVKVVKVVELPRSPFISSSNIR